MHDDACPAFAPRVHSACALAYQIQAALIACAAEATEGEWAVIQRRVMDFRAHLYAGTSWRGLTVAAMARGEDGKP